MRELNKLKVVLADKGRTGKWLSEQIGKSPTTVSHWCSNTNQPDLRTLDEIARLLEVEINDLIRNRTAK